MERAVSTRKTSIRLPRKGPLTGALVVGHLREEEPEVLGGAPRRKQIFQYPIGVDSVHALGFEFQAAFARALGKRPYRRDGRDLRNELFYRASQCINPGTLPKPPFETTHHNLMGPITDENVVRFMRDHLPDVFDDESRQNTFEYPDAMDPLERIEFEHYASLASLYGREDRSVLGEHFVNVALRMIAPYQEERSARHG